MPFQFPMQKVLDYREQLEEQAKVQLARAQQMYLREEKRIEELQAQLSEKQAHFYQNLNMDMGERWLLENFIKGIKTDLAASWLRLRQFHQLVEQNREILLERAKDRKVLDKLKEKQRERYHADEREKERKINDETATLRHKAPAL